MGVAIEFPATCSALDEFTDAESVVWVCEAGSSPGPAIWARKSIEKVNLDGSNRMIGQLSLIDQSAETGNPPSEEYHAVSKVYADIAGETMNAINKQINTEAVVDVLIYDTSQDDDGGLWVEQSLTPFVKLGIITLEATLLTVYDAVDGSVFTTIVTAGATSVTTKNGIIYIGTSIGLKAYDINNNYAETDWSSLIVNTVVNDVAVTSDGNMENSVAVFTDGGNSVINPDGSVSDVDTPDKQVSGYISKELVSVNEVDSSVSIWNSIPQSDAVAPDVVLTTSSTPALLGVPGVVAKVEDGKFAVGGVSGLTIVSADRLTTVQIDSTTNTGGGGLLPDDVVNALDFDESTNILTVCTATASTKFNGLVIAGTETEIATSVSTNNDMEVYGS